MFPLGAEWATISSLATGVGTLVLAVATFASVRSANRSARLAEVALQEQRRPLLTQSRLDDPVQKIMFVERHWVAAAGGRAAAEYTDGVAYLAISLRNVGSGIAVCQGWAPIPGTVTSATMPNHIPEEHFRLQSRDLYIPPGDIGMWQGALRNPDDPMRDQIAKAIADRQPFSIELLYSDQVGQQRTITRFGLVPTDDSWLATMNRHWYLDVAGPRADRDLTAAQEAVLRDREALDRAVEQAEASAAAESDGANAASDGPKEASDDAAAPSSSASGRSGS